LSDKVPSLLEKLSLNHWYKFVLYISGILFVLTVILGSKVPQGNLISFCLWSIGLSLFVWILDDIFYAAANYYFEGSHGIPDEVVRIVWLKYGIQVLFFIFWVIVVVRSF
jgi:hypothetical protein